MVRKLIKKLREKFGKKTDSAPKTEIKKETSWEERKKELLSNVRAKEPQKSSQHKKVSKDKTGLSRPDGKKKTIPVKEKSNEAQKPHEKKISGNNPTKLSEEKWDVSRFNFNPVEGKTTFHELNLPEEVMHAVFDLGFKYCTPIQAAILTKTLQGKDASGKAQTGTGKTAAFLITIFTRLLKNPVQKRKSGTPRALIMAPTRELVMQIANDAAELSKYTGLKIITVFGGIDYQKQQRQLNTEQIDVVVATPGRLLDFYNKKDIDLSDIEILVIDEADRMMDMGFIPDMKKIIRATPHKDKRQTLLFSATLPSEVLYLASSWTKDSEVVDIEPEHVAGQNVEQIVYIVSTDEKYALLYNTIVQKNLNRVIVFTNRRDEAKKLKDLLYTQGINTAVLSGDVDQRKRMKTLTDFKEGKIDILVATDVAGRGIHVEGISHVINFTLPEDPEDYVHRIGRTGRAGAEGISISFACEDDSFQIPAIEKFLGHKLEFTHPEESLLQPPPPPVKQVEKETAAKPRPPRKQGNYRKNYPNKRR